MSPKDLKELDEACMQSMRQADDEYLDEFIGSVGGCATKGAMKPGNVGKRVYMVARTNDDFEAQTTWESCKPVLMELLGVAGLGPALHRAHQAQGVPSALKWEDLIPDEAVQLLPKDGSLHGADVQALACLRVLQVNPMTDKLHWMRRHAARHLAQLLAEHPALMHPRLVWDLSRHYPAWPGQVGSFSRAGRQPEPMPMLHALLATPWGRLPSPSLGISTASMQRFALHPAVAAGIKCRAPHLIESTRTAKPEVWGKTAGQMLGTTLVLRSPLLTSLLHIERLRHESGAKGTLFGGSQDTKLGYRYALYSTFAQSWVNPGGDTEHWPASGATEFLNELSGSPTLSAKELRTELLSTAPRVFATPTVVGTHRMEGAAPRYESLLQTLVQVGLFEDMHSASQGVLEELFPNGDGAVRAHDGLDLVKPEVCHAFLRRWLDEGQPMESLVRRIRVTHSDTAWGQVASILETEKGMSDVIETAGAGASRECSANLASVSPASPPPSPHQPPPSRRARHV